MKIRYLAILPLAFLMSCGGDSTETDNDTTGKQDTVAENSEDIDMDESSTSLPSPLRVATMFKRSGLKYLPGLANSVDKASSYNTKFVQAQNMGVYSADMAYCVTNKQSNEAQKYMKTLRDIGIKVDLGKVFDSGSLFDRFNTNIDNEDSLAQIIADIQFQTDQQLAQNQQSELYGVIFAGAWVESMYIGTQVYKKDGNEKVVVALMEQMAVCKGIIQELEKNKDKDPGIAGMIVELQKIQTAIDAMPSMKKVLGDDEMDFSEANPTKEELDPIILIVEEVRNKIVN
jgi:hypothetical protein